MPAVWQSISIRAAAAGIVCWLGDFSPRSANSQKGASAGRSTVAGKGGEDEECSSAGRAGAHRLGQRACTTRYVRGGPGLHPKKVFGRREEARLLLNAARIALDACEWRLPPSRSSMPTRFTFPGHLVSSHVRSFQPRGSFLAVAILTDDEGAFLSLLVRLERATAYQISKVYQQSPVSNFGTSQGKIYPLVRRLKQRGLLTAEPVADDGRGAEELACTPAGRQAVRNWVMQIKPDHFLLDDPLRTKMQSFDLLSRDEKLAWLVDAKLGLQQKLEELERYEAEVTVPYKQQVHDNAVSAVRSRMDWLDRVLAFIVRGS